MSKNHQKTKHSHIGSHGRYVKHSRHFLRSELLVTSISLTCMLVTSVSLLRILMVNYFEFNNHYWSEYVYTFCYTLREKLSFLTDPKCDETV